MIIAEAPFRISLFGGSTDFPAYYAENRGMVVAGSIDQYSRISCGWLPSFHPFKSRVVYSQIETVLDNDNIKHGVVKAVINEMGLTDKGLEIIHSSDMPGKSGIGSSSTFLVCLLHALYALKGIYVSSRTLAEQAIYIEQTVLGDMVGSQDQICTAYGGFNHVEFKQGRYTVSPITIGQNAIDELSKNLLLVFTGIERTSSDIVKTYTPAIDEKKKIIDIADRGLEAVYKKDWELVGRLLDESWQVKRSLSDKISAPKIDSLYEKAKQLGAWGGKVCGSGGGGFMLLAMPYHKQQVLKASLPADLVTVDFKFQPNGSRIIFAR